MKAATRGNRKTATWRIWPDVLRGLSAVRDSSARSLLLFSPRPEDELGEIIAAIQLARGLTRDVEIIVGSPLPTASWIGEVRRAGADRTWWMAQVPVEARIASPPSPAGELDIDQGPCPALQILKDARIAVSACGRRGGRMVLARRHLEHRCLAGWETCPHWSSQALIENGGAR
ncbi:MAG: hypothetical protein V1774_05565 [Candidatus Eisenbacteria bacterium]